MNEAKIRSNLIAFVCDEQAGLTRLRGLRWVSGAGGWIILVTAFSLAFMEQEVLPGWSLVFAASLGGGMIGLGTWFKHTLDSWPVIRGYLDLERLRAEGGDPHDVARRS